jgi:hypothetical protein
MSDWLNISGSYCQNLPASATCVDVCMCLQIARKPKHRTPRPNAQRLHVDRVMSACVCMWIESGPLLCRELGGAWCEDGAMQRFVSQLAQEEEAAAAEACSERTVEELYGVLLARNRRDMRVSVHARNRNPNMPARCGQGLWRAMT